MEIRKYNDTDYPKLKKLLQLTGLYIEHLDKREIIQRKIERDPDSIILASENDDIIGSLFLVNDPWMSTIFRLSVHPEYRNQGIASQLMDEGERILKQAGIETVGVYLGNNNKASDFFSKRGFNDFGVYSCMEKKL